MCFYEQFEYKCKDFRWGNFKAHCNKEYRRGETCGMKLVSHVTPKPEYCSLCKKIEIKHKKWNTYESKIKNWEREGRLHELSATVEHYREEQAECYRAITKLQEERADRGKAIGRYVRSSANPAPAAPYQLPAIQTGQPTWGGSAYPGSASYSYPNAEYADYSNSQASSSGYSSSAYYGSYNY